MRFTTVDPIHASINWYAYVGNDPVNLIDPFGLTASDNGYINYGSAKWSDYLEKILSLCIRKKNLVGSDYVWNGNDPKKDGVVDCSGSVLYGLKQMGYDVPDITANEIYKTITTNASSSLPDTGKLRFFDDLTDNRGFYQVHVPTRLIIMETGSIQQGQK